MTVLLSSRPRALSLPVTEFEKACVRPQEALHNQQDTKKVELLVKQKSRLEKISSVASFAFSVIMSLTLVASSFLGPIAWAVGAPLALICFITTAVAKALSMKKETALVSCGYTQLNIKKA